MTTDQVLEIACDESGSEGEKLVGGNTDVFAHASVNVDLGSATDCILEARRRIRSPAEEYKAGHLLREKHRSVLTWLLAPGGPMHARAHVHLTNKAFYVVDRLVGLLLAQPAGLAAVLYRDGRRAFEPALWHAFLDSSNTLMRTKNRADVPPSVDSFVGIVSALDGADAPAGIVELLRQAGPRAEGIVARLLDDPTAAPLDPLIPALARTVAYWAGGGASVSIVHDRQTALTEERIARLKAMLDPPYLTGVRLVDSRLDARVQLADFLAGTARKIASDELNGRGDPELTTLLRPYVDASSIWGDDRSWAHLSPDDRP